ATGTDSSVDIKALDQRFHAAMDDDFNSPVLIAELFDAVRLINNLYEGKAQINALDLDQLKGVVKTFVFDILGLQAEQNEGDDFGKLMEAVLRLRNEAKRNRDFTSSDRIREELTNIGI